MPSHDDDHHHRSHHRGRGRGQRNPPREPTSAGRNERAAIPTGEPADLDQQPKPKPDGPAPSRPSRRARFRATLTEQPTQSPSSSSAAPQRVPAHAEKRRPKPSRARALPGDDLTSTLTHALRTPPFPDCPICFNPIRPEHQTWSCSPPPGTETPVLGLGDDKDREAHCCWSTFHLKCIRAWADKSVKELQEAWRARGESRPGEWRCPGCRATRPAVPQTYMCFCLRMRHPTPPRIATPHSCAQPCSRPRPGCSHACPLPCHPGPCPPCAVTIQVACFCGKEKHSAKCQLGMTTLSFSCAQPCRKPLRCDRPTHLCAENCHEGLCLPCPDEEQVQCWCGRQTKRVKCGEIKVEDSAECVVAAADGSQQAWTGSYSCDHPCERPFACSHHSCSKICHPPSPTPPPCPFDPERVASCACGRCRVARSYDEVTSSSENSSVMVIPPRTSCTSPLPTCTSPCSKPLPCGHFCKADCHWDSCPPCSEQVERTCRCGTTKHETPCSDATLTLQPTNVTPDSDTATIASEAILCDKPCQALRFCGRHQCGRICCPLAPFASLQRTIAKSSKRNDVSHSSHIDIDAQLQLHPDPDMRALHDCDFSCARILTCGNHRCSHRDHRGPCQVCPRGVFDELVCPCGRTVLEPPIPCGTRLRCLYPCARPPPDCGHPHVHHMCHEEEVVAGADTADEGLGVVEGQGSGGACPPCPYLTEKVCACGKKRVGNVRCSQERVSCGSACGKLLSCGFHHCGRLCHADACEACTAVCGKSRKSCLPAQHPCTQLCHAPAACPETEPCLAPVVLTCPCGNLRSTVPCSGTKLALACTGECEIRKRNTRLAEALGINEEKREVKGKVTWSVNLIGVARGLGPKFLGIVEKAFADFVTSDRQTQVLPHMPPDRRKFVQDLASVYRMDTDMVDQEPHRSVRLIRRIDTRVPTPLLSQSFPSTGKLVDLRSVGKASVSAWGGVGPGASGGRGIGGGSERWNTVAKPALGISQSGSTTLARVPSPAGGPAGSREVSPAPSRLSGGGAGGTNVDAVGTNGAAKGVWASPSVQAQRARESALAVVKAAVDGGAPGEASEQGIPDDWEDDV